jgi:hypothetical protein
MVRISDPPTLPRPVVLAGTTAFGDKVARTVVRHLERLLGRVPDSFQVLDSGQDLAALLGQALSAALHVRHTSTPLGAAPLVLVVCAAAELSATDRLRTVAAAARQEFRRSRLDGDICLCVYAGPVGQDLPSDDLLRDLQGFCCDCQLIATDTDGGGRRLLEEDAAGAVGLFLAYFVATDRVQDLVARPPDRGPGRARQFAFGVGRLDLSEDQVRRMLCSTLRGQVFELFFGDPDNGEVAVVPEGPITASSLAGLCLAPRGGLQVLERALGPAITTTSGDLLQIRMGEVAEETRRALAALLPLRKATWWGRLVAWLKRLFAWLRRRLGFAPSLGPNELRPRTPSSAVLIARLVELEKLHLRIAHLRSALQPAQETPGTVPFEGVLAEVLEVRQRIVQRCLPDVEELAWQLSRSLPLPDFLAGGQALGPVLAGLEAACEQALRLEQRCRLVHLDDYRPRLPEMATAVRPLCPGCGRASRRLALVPAHLRATFADGDCEAVIGRDDEVVFLSVQPGISLLDFLREGDHDAGLEQHLSTQAR